MFALLLFAAVGICVWAISRHRQEHRRIPPHLLMYRHFQPPKEYR